MSLVRATLVGVFMILGLSPGFAQAETVEMPDWAQRMVGSWVGQGTRVDLSTGQKTLVDAKVVSEWHPELPLPALISRNSLKETIIDSDGRPVQSKEYDRVYWIREVSRQSERAELHLGAGEDSSVSPASRGLYDALNQLMLVEQNLGLGTSVNSQSDLSAAGVTRYTEVFRQNGRKKAWSEIRYVLVP